MLPTQINRRTVLVLLAISLIILLSSSFFLRSTALSPFIDSLHSAIGLTRPQSGPITYIPFTFGWSMLLQTLRGYQVNEWPNIVIIDNSWTGYAHSQKEMLRKTYGVVDVIPTPVHLRFAQIQAYLDHLARETHAETYFWSHTDVLLVPNGTNANHEANECVKRANIDQNLGVMFFTYDLLSAVTIKAGQIAPWDTAMPQYGSDCDRYSRLRLAEVDVIDCDVQIGSIVHLRSVLSEEEFQQLYDETEPLEERVARVNKITDEKEKYSWRGGGQGNDDMVGMRETDRQASAAEGNGGKEYHEAKWGRDLTCELEGRTPAFDVPRYLE